MSRVDPIQNPKEGKLAPLFQQAESWMGFLPNDGLVMAHKPDVLTSFFGLAKAVYAEGKIPSGLKRMIGHISSLSSGCEYCSAHSAYGANENGVEKEKIEQIWEFRTSSLFSAAEKAALELAIKSSMLPNQSTDEDFNTLKKYYDNEAIIEIVSVIAMFGFLNRWNSTLKTRLEDSPNSFYQSLKKENNE
ncbi:carboxymuconolactone decarboxylase family protein [uncultured Croceitalea sp.]|uniref:carboxymuconolactone decarboxylase family protein n=1 Tax=uncultured Croceitalea sp. TaxID=1798908 RepID=UPI00330669A6